MKSFRKAAISNVIWAAALVVAAVAVWYIAALCADSSLIVPRPHEVFALTFRLLGSGSTWIALLATAARGVAAFALSVAFAMALGLLCGSFGKCAGAVNAVVTFLRALPTVSIILLLLLLLRSTLVPVAVAFLVVFPIVYSAFRREFERNGDLFDICRVYRVGKRKLARYVLLPLMLGELPDQCRDNLPLAIKVVVAGEVLALPLSGIGREMYRAKVNLMTANVVALTLLTLALCFAISGAFSLCKRRRNVK